MIKPIFIISLPRSGSTLLQTLMASHPDIATAPETWLLLPIASIDPDDRYKVRVYSNYSWRHTRVAISDFVKLLPGEREYFINAIREFVLKLYASAASGDSEFFLDKTPRYYLIIDFLAEVFPDAKFIILLRHPLDVLSSIITTWGGDRLHITHWAVDLFGGPFYLKEGYEKYASRSLIVKYEELVAEPDRVIKEVDAFLGLEHVDRTLQNLEWKANVGRMGDQKIKRKQTITSGSIGRWKRILSTFVRKRYASKYVQYLGQDVLQFYGLDEKNLLREVDALPPRWENTIDDTLALLLSTGGRFFAVKVLNEQWKEGIWTSELLN